MQKVLETATEEGGRAQGKAFAQMQSNINRLREISPFIQVKMRKVSIVPFPQV